MTLVMRRTPNKDAPEASPTFTPKKEKDACITRSTAVVDPATTPEAGTTAFNQVGSPDEKLRYAVKSSTV